MGGLVYEPGDIGVKSQRGTHIDIIVPPKEASRCRMAVHDVLEVGVILTYRYPRQVTSRQVRAIEQGSDVSVRWGGWGSNPRPTDYESAALTG